MNAPGMHLLGDTKIVEESGLGQAQIDLQLCLTLCLCSQVRTQLPGDGVEFAEPAALLTHLVDRESL